MGRLLILAALLAAPSPVPAVEDWSPHDTALEAAFALAVLVDVRQTSVAISHGWRENNPLMGRRPTDAKLAGAAALTIGGHAAISALLPPRHRRWWQAVTLSVEGAVVGRNFALGARLSF